MLVLTVNKKENIYITVDGRTIGLTVVKHSKGKTSIGFSAAKDISIIRENAKVQEEKKPEADQ